MNKIVHVLKCFADGEMQAATAYNLHRPQLGPEHENHCNILSPRSFPHLSAFMKKGCKASQTEQTLPRKLIRAQPVLMDFTGAGSSAWCLPGHLGIAEGAKLETGY